MNRLLMVGSMCWIGSVLFFIATSLLLYSSEDLLKNINSLRTGHFGNAGFLFVVLLLIFIGMFSSGMYYQYRIYKNKRDQLRFTYLAVEPDKYKAINDV